jgi:hypothetical protein
VLSVLCGNVESVTGPVLLYALTRVEQDPFATPQSLQGMLMVVAQQLLRVVHKPLLELLRSAPGSDTSASQRGRFLTCKGRGEE